jgi:hypothetical protein
MEYSKEDLIEHAMSRLEAQDDALQSASELINAAYAERRVIGNLLYLAFKKEKSVITP